MAIEASDLRIGNIVECSGEVYTVNGIPNSNTVLLFGWPYKEPPVSISPVIITEDWLVKFGFKSEWDGNFCHWTLDIGNQKIAPNGDNEYNFSSLSIKTHQADHVHYTVNGFWGAKRCDYVHQLQNLYHALTGEELQIKEA